MRKVYGTGWITGQRDRDAGLRVDGPHPIPSISRMATGERANVPSPATHKRAIRIDIGWDQPRGFAVKTHKCVQFSLGFLPRCRTFSGYIEPDCFSYRAGGRVGQKLKGRQDRLTSFIQVQAGHDVPNFFVHFDSSMKADSRVRASVLCRLNTGIDQREASRIACPVPPVSLVVSSLCSAPSGVQQTTN